MPQLLQLSIGDEGRARGVPRILLTVPEACASLGVSRSKLYELVSRKKIRIVKIGQGQGGGVRFRPEDLERFAEEHLA